jgi:hypothetical protein
MATPCKQLRISSVISINLQDNLDMAMAAATRNGHNNWS